VPIIFHCSTAWDFTGIEYKLHLTNISLAEIYTRRHGVGVQTNFAAREGNIPYWQVYFDGNRTIREALAGAGFPAPTPAQIVLVQNQQPETP